MRVNLWTHNVVGDWKRFKQRLFINKALQPSGPLSYSAIDDEIDGVILIISLSFRRVLQAPVGTLSVDEVHLPLLFNTLAKVTAHHDASMSQ